MLHTLKYKRTMNASERLRAAVIASDDRITFMERMDKQFNNELVVKTILSVFLNATDLLNNSGTCIEFISDKLRGPKIKVDVDVFRDARVRDVFQALSDNEFNIAFNRGNGWGVELDIPRRLFRFYHEAPELMHDDVLCALGLEQQQERTK